MKEHRQPAMLLKIRDAQWSLIGKRRVMIEAEGPDFEPGSRVLLALGSCQVTAVVDSVQNSGRNVIALDRDLRDNLGATIGDMVQVTLLQDIPEAVRVKVRVDTAAEAAEPIKAALLGAVVCEGNRERCLPGGDERIVRIGRTEPPGPVRIAAPTILELDGRPAGELAQAIPVYADAGSGVEVLTELPALRFSDVGGLESVKEVLTENIVYAMQKDKAELFARLGYRPSRGVLLHGPPGTGKTLLARATAGEAGVRFISVPGSKFKSKWYGESERILREVFKSARGMTPCIVFIDEIDAIACARDPENRVNIISQLLVIMDEIRDLEVYVIGATNVLSMIDSALLQPTRLLPVEVGLPDDRAREQIFRIHLKGVELGRRDLGSLLRLTEGYTGARIELACNQARMLAMKESGFSPETRLEPRHILAAIGTGREKREHLSEYM